MYHLAGTEHTEALDISGILSGSRAEATRLAHGSQCPPAKN